MKTIVFFPKPWFATNLQKHHSSRSPCQKLVWPRRHPRKVCVAYIQPRTWSVQDKVIHSGEWTLSKSDPSQFQDKEVTAWATALFPPGTLEAMCDMAASRLGGVRKPRVSPDPRRALPEEEINTCFSSHRDCKAYLLLCTRLAYSLRRP